MKKTKLIDFFGWVNRKSQIKEKKKQVIEIKLRNYYWEATELSICIDESRDLSVKGRCSGTKTRLNVLSVAKCNTKKENTTKHTPAKLTVKVAPVKSE